MADAKENRELILFCFEHVRKCFNPEAAKGAHAKYMYTYSGEGGGTWSWVVDDGKATLIEGPVDNPDTSFNESVDTFLRIQRGELDANKAFMQRKRKMSGSMEMGMKFLEFFPGSDTPALKK